MAVFNEPQKWAQTLGKDADVTTIPNTAGDTDPSIDKIFPSVFSIPLAQGGRAVPRSVLNGLFKLLGDSIFYMQNGGLWSYNSAFDYAVGRVVLYTDGNLYKCIQDNGVSSTVANPDNVAYWQRLDGSNLIPNQIIVSATPLSDANLHLCDGALLDGSGAYAQYVSMMIGLYNTDPTASCWITEANWQSSVSTYGECGKFVIDTVNNTVRIPKLSSFIQPTTTATELGKLTKAGAPNITGYMTSVAFNNGGRLLFRQSGAFSDTRVTDQTTVTYNATEKQAERIDFNASRSSSIYGNSSTIQPQSIKYYHYIVVGTVSKTDIQIDIDNVLTDLNGKADTDFSNITNTAKIAMAHNAMPVYSYDELTLLPSGEVYTAPSDGYVVANTTATEANQVFSISFGKANRFISQVCSSASGQIWRLILPVDKNAQFSVTYSSPNTVVRFFYTHGTVSEKV